ncbi:hypothetical protein [Lactiplantibacillus carotarum]|uniref:hypothetical protein n=1 Tax=Lactiplantibacillus carotarum TaxID=2993456 RepID=UPI00298F04EA|nr:hypothetical protein [Lactiplantibacillus carotarum]
MWKHRFMIKGSAQELAWLNRLAARKYLLVGIWNSWYHFKRVDQPYRIFSEYVASDLVTEMTKSDHLFKVLATYHVTEPDIQVVYTGTADAAVQKSRVAPGDPEMRLQVGLHMRDQALNTVNVFIYSVVAVWGLLLILALNRGGDVGLSVWGLTLVGAGLVVLRLYLAAKQLQKQIVILRRDTNSYDGAWMPTMHVFIDPLKADLDTAPLKDLGRWSLVGRGKHGTYWYDLQTLASESEIKASIKPYVAPTTQVNVISWLGLAPLGWFG